MISSQQLRKLLESSPEPILVDAAGASYPVEGLPEDATPPALLVATVTEAVKEVDGETITLIRQGQGSLEGIVDVELLAVPGPEGG